MKLNKDSILSKTKMTTVDMVYGMAQYQETVKASWENISLPFFVLV
jgi:hypothetical protein